MRYHIFVPCYNEEKCLEANIRKLNEFLSITELDYIITIVDDCSTDDTGNIALRLHEEIDRVGILSYEGEEPTRRENLLHAMDKRIMDFDVVAFIDCDLSTDIKDLPLLLTSVDSNTIVIGNRYHKDSVIKRSLKRLFISKCLNLYTKYLFNTGLDDHFIGFKAFPIKKFKDIYKYCMGYSHRRSMWADAELLIWARDIGVEIKEIPVTWIESKFSKLNFRREFGIILYTLWFKLGQWIR